MSFIVFEGIEGVGKTTQSKKLVDYFNSKGISSQYIKCPGWTQVGKSIRKITLSVDNKCSPYSKMLLMCADFYETSQEIKSLLESGINVVCDRYYFSCLAYQGADGVSDDVIKNILKQGNLVTPDKVIILDINPEEGLKRKQIQGEINFFELKGALFMDKVRDNYKKYFDNDDEVSYSWVDTSTDSENDTFEKIKTLLGV